MALSEDHVIFEGAEFEALMEAAEATAYQENYLEWLAEHNVVEADAIVLWDYDDMGPEAYPPSWRWRGTEAEAAHQGRALCGTRASSKWRGEHSLTSRRSHPSPPGRGVCFHHERLGEVLGRLGGRHCGSTSTPPPPTPGR